MINASYRFAGYYDVDNDEVIPSPAAYGTDLSAGPLPAPSAANIHYYVEVYACGPEPALEETHPNTGQHVPGRRAPVEAKAPPHPSPYLLDHIEWWDRWDMNHPSRNQPNYICVGDWLVSDGMYWINHGRVPARLCSLKASLGTPDPATYFHTVFNTGQSYNQEIFRMPNAFPGASTGTRLSKISLSFSSGSWITLRIYRASDGMDLLNQSMSSTNHHVPPVRTLQEGDVIMLQINNATASGSITGIFEALGGEPTPSTKDSAVFASHPESERNTIPASLSSSITASLASSIAAHVLNAPPPPGLPINPDVPSEHQRAPASLVGGRIYQGTETALNRWWDISNGSFAIVVNGATHNVTGLDFRPLKRIADSQPAEASNLPIAAPSSNLSEVCNIINLKLTGAYVRWTGERFIFNTIATGPGATLGPTSSAGTGTDVSWMLRTNADQSPKATNGSWVRGSTEDIQQNFRACRSQLDELVARVEKSAGVTLPVGPRINQNVPMMGGKGAFTSDIRDNFRAIKVITDMLIARYPGTWWPTYPHDRPPAINPEVPMMGPDARTADIRNNFKAIKEICDTLYHRIPT